MGVRGLTPSLFQQQGLIQFLWCFLLLIGKSIHRQHLWMSLQRPRRRRNGTSRAVIMMRSLHCQVSRIMGKQEILLHQRTSSNVPLQIVVTLMDLSTFLLIHLFIRLIAHQRFLKYLHQDGQNMIVLQKRMKKFQESSKFHQNLSKLMNLLTHQSGNGKLLQCCFHHVLFLMRLLMTTSQKQMIVHQQKLQVKHPSIG